MGHNDLEKAILGQLLSPIGIIPYSQSEERLLWLVVCAAGGAGPGGGTLSCPRNWTAESSESWRIQSARRDICPQTWSRSVIQWVFFFWVNVSYRSIHWVKINYTVSISTGSRSLICLSTVYWNMVSNRKTIYWVKVIKVSYRSIYWVKVSYTVGLSTVLGQGQL